MDPHDQAEAFLHNDALEKAQAYARRGRRHAQVQTEELRDVWVAAFKVWATDFRDALLRGMVDDLESELMLRGEAPPYDRVKAAADKLRAYARQLLDTLPPDEYRRISADLKRDLAAFIAAVPAAKKN